MERTSEAQTPADLGSRFDRLLELDRNATVARLADRACSREALADAAAPLAARIGAAAGARPIVALSTPNGIGFLSGLLACWRTDATVVLLDAADPPERRRRVALRCGATVLCSSERAWPRDLSEWSFETLERVPSPPISDTTAVIKVTSGSTGRPRGIAVSARALLADSLALEPFMGIGDTDRVVCAVPMSFSYGLGSLAVPALALGRELVIPEQDHPLGTLAAARSGAATVLPTVPAFLDGLLRRAPGWKLPPTLRLVITAGAPLRAETAQAFRKRFSLSAHVFYGASECGGITFDPTGTAAERGTVGVPVPGVEVSIAARSGLVTIRSDAVADAYIADEAQAPHCGLANGCFESSDLGGFVDGELRLLGRVEELIHSGGIKFSPREVERVVQQVEGVAEVAVRAGPKGCVAFLTTDGETGVTEDTVLAACRARLSAGKVPRSIHFLGVLPRTSRGKLDARALDELAEATTGVRADLASNA